MHYFYNFLYHFQPIRSWVTQAGAQFSLDPNTLILTIRHWGREIVLLPRFIIQIDDSRTGYTSVFTDRCRFVGWLPYEMKRWELASDKLAFKKFCRDSGLRVPQSWPGAEEPITDFIVKPRTGSFGRGILGPFRTGERRAQSKGEGYFAEQFIQGKACKIWFWNSTPLALAEISPPTIIGDGVRTLAAIADEVRGSFDVPYSLDNSKQILEWQGLTAESILPAGEKVLIDFLYGHTFDRISIKDPNCLPNKSDLLKAKLSQIGVVLHSCIPESIRSGTLFTVDAVLDHDDQLWLLEMNCHTVVHPNAYQPMLNDWAAVIGREKENVGSPVFK
jgi:hypothetical protein